VQRTEEVEGSTERFSSAAEDDDSSRKRRRTEDGGRVRLHAPAGEEPPD
jgi:hypothetical protein